MQADVKRRRDLLGPEPPTCTYYLKQQARKPLFPCCSWVGPEEETASPQTCAGRGSVCHLNFHFHSHFNFTSPSLSLAALPPRLTFLHPALRSACTFFRASPSSGHQSLVSSPVFFPCCNLLLSLATSTDLREAAGQDWRASLRLRRYTIASTSARIKQRTSTMLSKARPGRQKTDIACIFVHAGAGYHSKDNELHHLQACEEYVRLPVAWGGCLMADME